MVMSPVGPSDLECLTNFFGSDDSISDVSDESDEVNVDISEQPDEVIALLGWLVLLAEDIVVRDRKNIMVSINNERDDQEVSEKEKRVTEYKLKRLRQDERKWLWALL